MKNLLLEDELKYFFLIFYWDVCLFTLVKPIIMGGGGGGGWFSLRHDFNVKNQSILRIVIWLVGDHFAEKMSQSVADWDLNLIR